MTSDNTLLLRALKLNALFSGFSTICMFIAGGWLATQFSLDSATSIYVIAACLAVFGLMLTNIVRTKNIRFWEITSIIVGDLAWVVASIALVVVFHETITIAGLVMVDLVAIAVLVLAVMQIRGLIRYQKSAKRDDSGTSVRW